MVQAAQGKPARGGAAATSAAASQSNMAQRRFEFENAISDEQLFHWD